MACKRISQLAKLGSIASNWFGDDPELTVVAEGLDGEETYIVYQECCEVITATEPQAWLFPDYSGCRYGANNSRDTAASYEVPAYSKARQHSPVVVHVPSFHCRPNPIIHQGPLCGLDVLQSADGAAQRFERQGLPQRR